MVTLDLDKLIEDGNLYEKMAELHVGQIVKGVVACNFKDFSFVKVANLSCILPVSEISFDTKPKCLKVGTEIEAVVIKISEEHGIMLSIKRLKGDPWQTIEDDYKIGQRVNAKVKNIASYGVFVEFGAGLSKVQETNSRILSEEDSYQRIRDIAVFFRTNNEVYRGYSLVKPFVPKDVRIRIQGARNCELWREREIYYLIHTLLSHPDTEIELRNVEKNTVQGIKEFIQQKMDDSPNWDRFYLDLVYTLVLNYIDSIRTDDVQHTWSELAEYIKDIAGNDDGGQVYKIYEHYRNERIIQEDPLTIILTTMHKVKGLEFDAVFITPSSANLPLKPHRAYNAGEPLAEDDLADIAEERRLLFVAYTRAKKFLHVYKGDRERAVDDLKIYIQPNQTAIYTEKDPSMDKYFLSYNAMERCFLFNDYITKSVRKDDEIQLIEYRNNYYILHGTQYIGRLSNNSDIVRNARNNHIQRLRHFHVSDICVWTYEETIQADRFSNR